MTQAQTTHERDSVLCLRAQSGDRLAADVLVRRWERYAFKLAGGYHTPLSDNSDMRQEALIGLNAAIRGFQPDRGVHFPVFVRLCVLRHVYTIIRRDTTSGRYRSDDYPLSLDAAIDGDEDLTLVSIIADIRAPQPGRHEQTDAFRALFAFIATALTELERESLLGIVRGESYADIVARLPEARNEKAVDNAVVRARLKCAPFLADLRDAA